MSASFIIGAFRWVSQEFIYALVNVCDVYIIFKLEHVLDAVHI